jgi:hypothetical protein
MLKTAASPGGLPMEKFDDIRAGVLADRSQFFRDLSVPFYGANRPGAKVSQGLRDSFWLQGMQAGFKATPKVYPGFAARPVLDEQGRDQRRSAGIPQGLTAAESRRLSARGRSWRPVGSPFRRSAVEVLVVGLFRHPPAPSHRTRCGSD